MSNISIVVVAYNRPESLKRLLISLSKVNYMNDTVRLYISIDKDEKNIILHKKVVEIAKKFKWNFGEKIVNVEKNNLGLKKHILQCGNLTEKFENIIVLEDDLVVSPMMYIYAKQVLDYYKDDNRIAGYGLYSFQRNPINNLPFYPLNEACDIYFMQYACSWGQMWTKGQWKEFDYWYKNTNNEDFSSMKIPPNIKLWGEKSWLKYYIKYVIETNKFFVYPQVGLTSNFTDKGIHNTKSSFAYQCLNYYTNDYVEFRFKQYDNAKSVYDAFFENIKLNELLGLDKNVICDFYGEKNLDELSNNNYYLLSIRDYNFKILKEYSLEMYPYELNIINDINGNDIKLYKVDQLQSKILHRKSKENNEIKLFRYSYKLDMLTRKQNKLIINDLLKEFFNRFLNKIKGKRK